MPWTWLRMDTDVPTERVISELNQRMKNLQSELKDLRDQQYGVTTFPVGGTTPSVSAGAVFKTANTGATSITAFTNGRKGQVIVLVFGDAVTTLVNGTNLKLNGAANFTAALGNTKQFVSDDGTVFREVEMPATFA